MVESITADVDVLVIGGGQAALRAAIEAKKQGTRVAMAARGKIGMGGSSAISDGIHSAIFHPEDSPDKFWQDMIRGGRELGNAALLKIIAEECTDRVAELKDIFGVEYYQEKEVSTPGHSYPRRIYAEGGKGGRVIRKLRRYAEEQGIQFYEKVWAVDLLQEGDRIQGAVFLAEDRILVIRAGSTILATGGTGGLYDHSDNPRDVTGEGTGMALRYGAKVQDMEFVQFYPYRLVEPVNMDVYTKIFGKGAVMLNSQGERFMDPFPKKELETRDILCYEMYKQGDVYLDVSHVPEDVIRESSPQLDRLLRKGYDGPLKMSPVEHYSLGGIKVDDYGRTGVPGLFACGECTGGIHGANRLGGGSLTESLVFGTRTGYMAAMEADADLADRQGVKTIDPEKFDPETFRSRWESETFQTIRRNLKAWMWTHCGIERHLNGLEQLDQNLNQIMKQLEPDTSLADQLMADMIQVSRATVTAALMRKESRGAHRRADAPDTRSEWKGNIVFDREQTRFYPVESDIS
ncbi:MAG: FAD-binding protein [Bacillaceae bacterium]|nr:FAD-binding protein [Bacillaceae bacterium]